MLTYDYSGSYTFPKYVIVVSLMLCTIIAKMAASEVWNVFLPKDLLKHSSSYLAGHIDKSNFSVYVTDVCTAYVDRDGMSIIGSLTSAESQDFCENSVPVALSKRAVRLNIAKLSTKSFDCRVYVAGNTVPCKSVCILFDPKDIMYSFVLSDAVENESHLFLKNFPSRVQLSNLFSLYQKALTKSKVGIETDHVHRNKKGAVENTFIWCLLIFNVVFVGVELVLKVVSLKRLWSFFCVQSPATTSHITCKLKKFRTVQSLITLQQRSKLILFDTCGQQFLDSLLGMTVMLFVIGGGHTEAMAVFISELGESIAGNLNSLLHWLMGAPAGLKLNAQLTEYMGHFFLYHVYLWSAYLSILRPVLGWVMWIAAAFGVLGLSTQLCLVQDIVSMLTLHIYCFYVYAARLYSLQMYAISSLWRLFRGKKWNVLRLRVDSALYDIDQLCVGTLLFTVFLFLLPTTLLYYAVFTVLRLLVLNFHQLLTVVMDILDGIPVVSLTLHIIKSKSVAGELLFTVLQDGANCLILSMQTTHLSLLKLYHLAQVQLNITGKQHHQKYSWSELLRKLAYGSLLYPWISSSDEDTNVT